MTEAEYRDLPEDIARRMANALESARSPADPCLAVDTDIDVVLWRVPRFTFRRPDVVVYTCIDDPAGKPSARETVMVVEVTSPSTAREDLIDKKAPYASAGIPLYLAVVLDDKYDIRETREFHLDAATSAYRLHAAHRAVPGLEQPVRLALPIADLITA